MQNGDNYALVCGVLISKDKNADSSLLGFKRPVLDVEVLCNQNQKTTIECITVVISDVFLAKTTSGYKPGDILTITGEIQSTPDGILYLNATDIERIYISSNDNPAIGLVASRSELLTKKPRLNLVLLCGIVLSSEKNKAEIRIDRQKFTRGDLQKYDIISINLSEAEALKISEGDTICFLGEIGNDGTNCIIYPSDIKILAK